MAKKSGLTTGEQLLAQINEAETLIDVSAALAEVELEVRQQKAVQMAVREAVERIVAKKVGR